LGFLFIFFVINFILVGVLIFRVYLIIQNNIDFILPGFNILVGENKLGRGGSFFE